MYSLLVELTDFENNWTIRRECDECFGELEIQACNLYTSSNIFKTVKYATNCEVCNTPTIIGDRFIPENIRQFAQTNRPTNAKCKTIIETSLSGKHKCVNCRMSQEFTRECVKMDCFLTIERTLYYRAWIKCRECDHFNSIERASKGSLQRHIRRPYIRYGVNKYYHELKQLEQEQRNIVSRQILGGCFIVFLFPIYVCIKLSDEGEEE